MPDTMRGHSGEESAIKNAIRECIAHGILADYLKRKGSEVENMLIAEYSYEEDIQVKQQEAEQQGRTKGRQEGLILSGRIFQTESIRSLQMSRSRQKSAASQKK